MYFVAYMVKWSGLQSSYFHCRILLPCAETSLQKCSWVIMGWKYPANLQQKIQAKVQFIERALRHGCSPVNLLHIFKISFLKNNSEGLLLGVSSILISNENPWTWYDISSKLISHIVRCWILNTVWITFENTTVRKVLKYVLYDL